jgi:integrase
MPEKMKNGKYKGRVKLKGYPQKTKSPFRTWNEAKAWELRTAEKLKNPPPENRRWSFGQISELWLKNCVKRYKAPTCAWKANIIDGALDFWQHDPYLEDLSIILIEEFLDSKPGKTANRYRRELRNLFNFAIQRELMSENLAKKIDPYKEKKFKRYVPPAEDIEAIKEVATPLEHDIIVIAYNTAARAGEIRNLKWEDVDLEKKTITIWTGKRGAGDRNDDTLEMTATLYDLLLEKSKNKTHKGYVLSFEGHKLEKWWVNLIMPRLTEKARVNGEPIKHFTLHCIRHHIAALLSYKLSLGEISKILRHRNLTTTDLYLRSLVTIKTKGIKILDDIQKIEAADVISFQEAVSKRC